MGIFIDKPEEKQLRESINSVAQLVGSIASGRLGHVPQAELQDAIDQRVGEAMVLYETVENKYGARRARSIAKASVDIAEINAGKSTGGSSAQVVAARNHMNQIVALVVGPS